MLCWYQTLCVRRNWGWNSSAKRPTAWGSRGERKRGENWEETKENCKREGGKLKNGRWKRLQNEERIFFFFFFLSLFETTKILFWVYQIGNFLPGKKHFTPGKIFLLRPWPQTNQLCRFKDREMGCISLCQRLGLTQSVRNKPRARRREPEAQEVWRSLFIMRALTHK